MFGTIRKHQSWLWAIIITGTIVSFLIWFSPDARWGGRGRGSGQLGNINGQPITQTDFNHAYAETRLLYFLNFQKWPDNDERARQMDFDVEQQAFLRLVRLAKVKEEKIQVNDETVGQLAQRLLGPKTPLEAFVKEVLAPAGLGEADFERFLRHDAAIQQLGSVAGLSGRLIPPREVETAYRQEHGELDLQGVFFNVSNYIASVTISEPALLQWYTNNMALFRVPEKVRVSYVEFARTNYYPEVDKEIGKMTNYATQLEQYYLSRNPDTFKDESGKVLSKEAAIQKLRETDRNTKAIMAAARKANELASKLYDEKDHRVEAFEKFASANGLTSKVSEPFDEMDGPASLRVSEHFAQLAFSLTNKEEAVAFQPVDGENGLYLIAMKDRIPSTNPTFESVRKKVEERYRFSRAQEEVRRAGISFHSKLTNGLAQGKSFATLATESNLKVVSLPPISRATRELPSLPLNIYPNQLKGVAFTLQPGKVSSYLPSLDGGYILYLRAAMPIDEAKMRAALPEFLGSMRAQRQNEAFAMWFEAQRRAAGIELPETRNQRQRTGGGRAPSGKAPVSQPKAK
jgi:hypothetical protein